MAGKLLLAQRAEQQIAIGKRTVSDVKKPFRKSLRNRIGRFPGFRLKNLIVSAVIENDSVFRNAKAVSEQIRADFVLCTHRLQDDAFGSHQRNGTRLKDPAHQRSAHTEYGDGVTFIRF